MKQYYILHMKRFFLLGMGLPLNSVRHELSDAVLRLSLRIHPRLIQLTEEL